VGENSDQNVQGAQVRFEDRESTDVQSNSRGIIPQEAGESDCNVELIK
jgi:hypothetical protein